MVDLIISIISIIIISFNLLILMTISKMHLKQKSIREGYFKVVFTQIIIEFLFNLVVLVIIIIILSNCLEKGDEKVYYNILLIVFDLLYNCDILYHIQTIFYLINNVSRKDSGDIFNNNDDSIRSESYTSKKSIDLKKYTYKRIHFFSFFFSLIHSLIYYLLYLKQNEQYELKWYFFFLNKNVKNLEYFLFFILNFLFFGVSIRYCFIKQEINGNIKLKFYSKYCFFSGLISLLFPIKIIINYFVNNNEIINIIFGIIFLLYLIGITYFRLNCYYVQYILSSKGNSFITKLCFGLKILFTGTIVPSPNFIDFNNSFLYHSLSNEKDISIKKEKIDENDDIDCSRSYSLT